MKEKELIQIIKSTLNSKYIGDDCAYLKDLGIVITQDSLVQDVHFKMDYITPYQLGYKSVMVNISDICASGAEPKYITISLSLPKYIDENFVKGFYKGAQKACANVKIVGGDITGSDKIFISVTAIGSVAGRKISSRSNAKAGYKVIVSGEHGNSAKGLELLQNKSSLHREDLGGLQYQNPPYPSLIGEGNNNKFIHAHLMPEAQREFSKQISHNADCEYAMMDTSDGLGDALMQIAKASKVTISVDTSKIPHDSSVDMEKVLYGGEDYGLVAAVPEKLLKNISDYTIIGEVQNGTAGVYFDETFCTDIENRIYNHFKD